MRLQWRLVFALCVAGAVLAQHFPLEFLGNREHPVIANQFVERGALWVAGREGLSRFDGHSLIDYGARFGIRDAAKFVARNSNGLWVGTVRGLFRIRNEKVTVFGKNLEYTSAVETPQGLFLLADKPNSRGEQDQALQWLSSEAQSLDAIHPRFLPVSGHETVTLDHSGVLWFPCGDQICEMNDTLLDDSARWKVIRHGVAQGLPAERWDVVLRDAHGRVWVKNRLFTYRAESANGAFHALVVHGRRAEGGTNLLIESQNAVWTDCSEGLLSDDGTAINLFAWSSFSSPPTGFVETFYQDHEGGRWIATSTGGVARWIGGGTLESWTAEGELGGIATWLLQDACGAIYTHVGHASYKLSDRDQSWKAVTFPSEAKGIGFYQAAPVNSVIGMQQFPPGVHALRRKVYLHVGCGLTPGPGRQLTFPEDPGHVRGLKQDFSGNLWFATTNGLFGVTPSGQWRHFTAADGMLQTTLQCLGVGPDGAVWVGSDTPVGFSRLNGLTTNLDGTPIWTHFRPPQETYVNGTFFLGFDRKGNLWRGTGSGVYVSDGVHVGEGDWRQITTRDGLAGNDQALDAFLPARDQTVWVATDGGITRFSPRFNPLARHAVHVNILGRSNPGPLDTGFKFDIGLTPTSLAHDVGIEYRVDQGAWKQTKDLSLQVSGQTAGVHELNVRIPATRWLVGENIGKASFIVARKAQNWQWLYGLLIGLTLTAALFVTLSNRRRKQYSELKTLYTEIKDLNPYVRRARMETLPVNIRSKLGSLLSKRAESTDATGAILAGRFVLEHVVAQGGFATVYFGRDLERKSEPVAVKIIHDSTAHQEWLRRKWETEQATLLRLDHPGIVHSRFAGIDDDHGMYIATDYVQGITLRACLKQGRMETHRVLAIVKDVCTALEYAHNLGVLHCDLKPDNVMLRNPGQPEERAVLIDFGMAVLRQGQESVAASLHVAGTLDYMAPEQLGESVSAATDLYSLAAVVFEMLTGSRWRITRDDADIPLSKVLLSEKARSDLKLFFQVTLAYQREHRLQTAPAFFEQLRAALEWPTPQSDSGAMQ